MFRDAPTVRKEDLKQAVIQTINELFKNRSNILKVLEQNIAYMLSSHLHDKLVKVEKELEALQIRTKTIMMLWIIFTNKGKTNNNFN